jgi:hypothetical protein
MIFNPLVAINASIRYGKSLLSGEKECTDGDDITIKSQHMTSFKYSKYSEIQ